MALPRPLRLLLAESYGEPAGEAATRIEFPLSQQELAKMAGVSREAVNKLLRVWQSEGLIAHDHTHGTSCPSRVRRTSPKCP